MSVKFLDNPMVIIQAGETPLPVVEIIVEL
jgi:hypothetical protein